MVDQTDPAEGAIDIREFCRRNSISKSSAYYEIAAGKLIAHKFRSKTLIKLENERAWRSSLPKLERASA
jgi:hypothetical protein